MLTGIERVQNIFARKPVDQIPVGEDFWEDTKNKWVSEGHVGCEENLIDHFDFDIDRDGLVNCYADSKFGLETIEETEDTILLLDGNGAKLRQHKHHASTPEHVDFAVKTRKDWETKVKPLLIDVDESRIPFESYRKRKQEAQKRQRHFSNDSFGPFEMMQRLCGHENLLMNMVIDPEWIKDMVMTYIEFNINHFEVLFSKEGLPHSTMMAEDLGYKFKPFFSPAMFNEIFYPGFKRMFDYVHSKGLKMMMHSCGYVEPLIPGLIDAGLDCLEAMEVKAGMDMPTLFKKYGENLVFFGNIDIRALESNNLEILIKEMIPKITSVVSQGGGYILHSDHSISPKVEYKTFYEYLEIGKNIKCY